LRRNEPVDERLAELALDVRMPSRVHQHHAVLVEQARVAFDQDHQLAAVPEWQPGAAIGQDVGVHRRGGIERRAHAGAGFPVPGPFRHADSGEPPYAQLSRMRAAAVGSRYERRLGLENAHEGGGRVFPCRIGRIVLRAHQHEVVVHDVFAIHEIALRNKRLL